MNPESTRAKHIRVALKAAQNRGVPLGNPNPLPALEQARQAASTAARAFAAELRHLQGEGRSLRGIARELDRRGVPTVRGCTWQAAQVAAILKRPRDPLENPFFVPGPAIISFSGGRTSGYLLRKILDAYSGELPDSVRVVFANTGKERPETLDFVAECGACWGVPIVWLEYDWDQAHRTRIVRYETAARQGEPYAALIERKQFLPNPVMRFCTSHLKVERIHAYARHWCGWQTWTNVIGLRYDELRWVYKMLNGCRAMSGPRPRLPLHPARIAEADILAWWKQQPIDFALESHEFGRAV